jgi:hypothetical protein
MIPFWQDQIPKNWTASLRICMKKAELDLTVEGDIADFLGVNIERSEDGKNFNLTQPHLIDDILKELRLEAHYADIWILHLLMNISTTAGSLDN